MDVLVYLATSPGRVVSKEELIGAVWSGSFVEEGVLSQAVHSLRKVLGDDAREPRYIQTIPKRGYRLVASVTLEPLAVPEIPAPEESGKPPRSRPVAPFRNRVLTTIAVLSVTALLSALWLIRERPRTSRGGGEAPARERAGTRIVVLPFENLGKVDDSFFADGLTEEITKDLASFPALQIISRTSAKSYTGSRKSLPEIGRDLQVDYVLEGTVRWATAPGGRPRVRITPQLIRVADDAHVWADAFEGEVADIFKVQAEISRRVIDRLGISLLPKQKQSRVAPPTRNLEAYRAYLRGLELRNQPFYSVEHLRKAVSMFERAIDLDPGFVDAWAELSQTHSYLAFNADPSPAQVERARQSLNRAIELAPDLRSVRLAQAYFSYRCLGDYEAARKQLAEAARLSPNDAEILQTLGFVLRRQGRLAEAIEVLQRSFSLDPKTVKLVWTIAETCRALRDYKQADTYYAQAISLAPDQAVYWEDRALNRLAWTGDLEDARAVLTKAPTTCISRLVPTEFQFDLYERKYERALARLSLDRLRDLPPQLQTRVATLAAIARERAGDHSGALAAAEVNRVTLAARVARFPNEAAYRAYLAVALAQLGRKDEALAQIEQSVQQESSDAFSGPRISEIQALVEAIVGRRREAIDRLAHLLATAYQAPISAAELRLSPVWDPLRGDPAFEDLLR
jgi:TolB-like protein/DNA-binding winged helix-turn-helix (wHTH) protein/cytochrome c-type biogenesis protein CcmH/NrfG/cation transport regulator ChaC